MSIHLYTYALSRNDIRTYVSVVGGMNTPSKFSQRLAKAFYGLDLTSVVHRSPLFTWLEITPILLDFEPHIDQIARAPLPIRRN